MKLRARFAVSRIAGDPQACSSGSERAQRAAPDDARHEAERAPTEERAAEMRAAAPVGGAGPLDAPRVDAGRAAQAPVAGTERRRAVETDERQRRAPADAPRGERPRPAEWRRDAGGGDGARRAQTSAWGTPARSWRRPAEAGAGDARPGRANEAEGRPRRPIASEPAPLAEGEASRSFSLYHSRISATKAAAVELHRRRKARLDEAIALGARRRPISVVAGSAGSEGPAVAAWGSTKRPSTVASTGSSASLAGAPGVDGSLGAGASSASEAGADASRGSNVGDDPGPRFAVDTDSEGRGFRRARLRWPLRPGVGRPQLVGGALDALELPAPERWADLAELLAGVAPAAGGGAPMIALDTETTGVGQSSGTIAFLIGAAYFDGEALVVEQWTLLRLSAEAAMLRDLAAHLDAQAGPATTLVTFNGASFDLPLLRTRLRRHGVTAAFLAATHVDLLLPARRLWREQESDCRLGTLERSRLGVRRQGDVAGSEIPQAYWGWLEDPDEPRRSALIERVHVHNVVDLLTLPALAVVIAAAIESPSTLAEALRVARLEVARGDDRRALAALEGWLPTTDASGWSAASAPSERRKAADEAAGVVRAPVAAHSRVALSTSAASEPRAVAVLQGSPLEPIAQVSERLEAAERVGRAGSAACGAIAAVAAGPRGHGTRRHALGGIRERMARLGVGAPSGAREVARIRAASCVDGAGSTAGPVDAALRDVAAPRARLAAREHAGGRVLAGPCSLRQTSRAPSRAAVEPPCSAETRGAARYGGASSEPSGPTVAARGPAGRSPRAARVAAQAPLSTLERRAWGLAAGLLRRLGEDARSAALWAQICRRSPGDPEAHEALAKLLEHRLGDLPRALAVTRASSAPCPRRLARLRRKLAKHSHREPESVYG